VQPVDAGSASTRGNTPEIPQGERQRAQPTRRTRSPPAGMEKCSSLAIKRKI